MSAEDAAAGEHARLMDGLYRGQRHIYDLTRKYYLFGRDGTIAGLNARPGQSVLELGCGTGRNMLMAARRFPGIALHGLDISPAMLETARARFSASAHSATFVAGDAARFAPADFGVAGFDRILLSYALSMIPDWTQTLAAALDALSPGGSLHVVDFGDQSGLPRWFRAGLRAWLAKFHVSPRDDFAERLQTLCRERNMALAVESLGGGYATRAVAARKTRLAPLP